jgi:hypothetical protein
MSEKDQPKTKRKLYYKFKIREAERYKKKDKKDDESEE